MTLQVGGRREDGRASPKKFRLRSPAVEILGFRANTPLIYKGNYLHGSGARIRMIIRIKGIFLNEVALRSLSNLEAELCMCWDIELLFLASTKPIYGDFFHK